MVNFTCDESDAACNATSRLYHPHSFLGLHFLVCFLQGKFQLFLVIHSHVGLTHDLVWCYSPHLERNSFCTHTMLVALIPCHALLILYLYSLVSLSWLLARLTTHDEFKNGKDASCLARSGPPKTSACQRLFKIWILVGQGAGQIVDP